MCNRKQIQPIALGENECSVAFRKWYADDAAVPAVNAHKFCDNGIGRCPLSAHAGRSGLPGGLELSRTRASYGSALRVYGRKTMPATAAADLQGDYRYSKTCGADGLVNSSSSMPLACDSLHSRSGGPAVYFNRSRLGDMWQRTAYRYGFAGRHDPVSLHDLFTKGSRPAHGALIPAEGCLQRATKHRRLRAGRSCNQMTNCFRGAGSRLVIAGVASNYRLTRTASVDSLTMKVTKRRRMRHLPTGATIWAHAQSIHGRWGRDVVLVRSDRVRSRRRVSRGGCLHMAAVVCVAAGVPRGGSRPEAATHYRQIR